MEIARDGMTVAVVEDGQLTPEQIAQLTQASEDANEAKEIAQKINTHLVIGENSIDIVGDDGTVYASYGASTVFYGEDSEFVIDGSGFQMLKPSDGSVYFRVLKAEAGQEVRAQDKYSDTTFKIPEHFQTFTYVVTAFAQAQTYVGLIAKIEGSTGTWRRATKSIFSYPLDEVWESAESTSYAWAYNEATKVFTKRVPAVCAYYGTSKAVSKVEFDGVDLNSPAVKIVNIGTEHFTGTAAHSVSAEHVMSIPVVEGYTPIALSHTNAGGTSGYRLTIIESAIDTDAMTFTFKAFNTAASQAVGDLTVFLIYARN